MNQKNIKDFLSADKKDIKYSWFLGEFLLSFFCCGFAIYVSKNLLISGIIMGIYISAGAGLLIIAAATKRDTKRNYLFHGIFGIYMGIAFGLLGIQLLATSPQEILYLTIALCISLGIAGVAFYLFIKAKINHCGYAVSYTGMASAYIPITVVLYLTINGATNLWTQNSKLLLLGVLCFIIAPISMYCLIFIMKYYYFKILEDDKTVNN